jgi:hypothetical protein
MILGAFVGHCILKLLGSEGLIKFRVCNVVKQFIQRGKSITDRHWVVNNFCLPFMNVSVS